MGAVIELVHTASPQPGEERPSSVALAAKAARAVLDDSALSLHDLDLLVNVGIYRDGHICEPAMAPLIQQEIARRGGDGSTGMLSFDLSNGAGGMLNAFHAVDALLEARSLESAMIVASDVDPSPALTIGWNLDARGAALLLRPGARDTGFETFRFDSFVKHSDLFESRLHWDEARQSPPLGQRLHIAQSDEFLDRAVESTTRSIGRLLHRRRSLEREVDLIVASNFPADFPERLGESLGLPCERIARAPGCSYTAGPAAGFATAVSDGRLADAQRVLFVAVGAGISVGLALYRT